MRCPREGSEMVGDGDGVMKGRRRKVSYAAGSRKGRGGGERATFRAGTSKGVAMPSFLISSL